MSPNHRPFLFLLLPCDPTLKCIVMMSKPHHKFTVATYNCNCQLTSTFHLTNILTHCQNQNINILLLQEVGLKIPILPPPLNQFRYICEPPNNKNHPINHTTGIFLHQKLLPTLYKLHSHPSGRYTCITLNLPRLLKEYKALRAFTFHINCFLAFLPLPKQPSEKLFREFLTQKQKKTLRVLAKHKIGICPTLEIKDWHEWIKIIKSTCKKIKDQIRCINFKNKVSQSQLRGELLKNNRKKFYKKFVFSSNATKKGTCTIWNEATQSNTTAPSELKSVLVKEARKFFKIPLHPHPIPPNGSPKGTVITPKI